MTLPSVMPPDQAAVYAAEIAAAAYPLPPGPIDGADRQFRADVHRLRRDHAREHADRLAAAFRGECGTHPWHVLTRQVAGLVSRAYRAEHRFCCRIGVPFPGGTADAWARWAADYRRVWDYAVLDGHRAVSAMLHARLSAGVHEVHA